MPRRARLSVSFRALCTLLAGALLAATAGVGTGLRAPSLPTGAPLPGDLGSRSKTGADALLRRHAACFVPNLGQWQHGAKFVHRSGPMTVFLQDRGWTLDLEAQDQNRTRHVALAMTFEGDKRVPEIHGEKKLPGHHNYFLGNDKTCWRTGVPLYGSVRYQDLYAGIDLRLREMDGVPEYDLLLQPGADLSSITVQVDGARSLSMKNDGSLVIDTELGPLTQPRPRTWQLGTNGEKQEVACAFELLGPARFGFKAPGWDRNTDLIIDPSLIWSTFLGDSGGDRARTLSVDTSGVVTLAGWTSSTSFPTTTGSYDSNRNGSYDVFVSRLDPSKSGSAQLLYSTFLGGSSDDYAYALFVDASGVVTVAGPSRSTDFPTTGAYDTTQNGNYDVFVSRLDPSKSGSAQLVYSTYLGSNGGDYAYGVFSDSNGVITVGGRTVSSGFPTTGSGTYDNTHNGGVDVYVSRLDPSKSGNAQLVYSTFLGGSGDDSFDALGVDSSGVVTVVGDTVSSNFPTTSTAYDTTYNGQSDVFVSRLDPSKSGSAQLTYSTCVGDTANDKVDACHVDSSGIVTVSGYTSSSSFPTTSGAYDTTHNGGRDGFVIRLDPGKTGSAQLAYSTFLGGSRDDSADSVFVTGSMVTVAGTTASSNFPTTSSGHDTTHNGQDDAFVSQLDLSKSGTAQMVYSTFLGGSNNDSADALSVAGSGVVTVSGHTYSSNFPTTSGAYDGNFSSNYDAFVCRLGSSMPLYADVQEVSLSTGGTQKLTVNAGAANVNRSYWIFGSVSGTTPGVTLESPTAIVTIPLNPDTWTIFTFSLANSSILSNTKGTLDANGMAQAGINVPQGSDPGLVGLVLYHAYLVYDANNNFYLASNAVSLKLVK